MIPLTGILTGIFVTLAVMNPLKRYTKSKVIRKVSFHHYLFGALAFLSALTHFVLNLTQGNTSISGLILLIFVLTTVVLGGAFKNTKKKQLFKVHRIFGAISIILLVVHIFTN